jgi:hypothetical protein
MINYNVRSVGIYDRGESIIRKIKAILEVNLQRNIDDIFDYWKSNDINIQDIGEPIIMNTDNIMFGGIDQIQLSIDRLPCVLVNIPRKLYGNKKAFSTWTSDSYMVDILSMITYDNNDALYFYNMRLTEAIIRTLSENEYLDGLSRGGSIRQVIYSPTFIAENFWLSGSQISLEYLGASD